MHEMGVVLVWSVPYAARKDPEPEDVQENPRWMALAQPDIWGLSLRTHLNTSMRLQLLQLHSPQGTSTHRTA
jgi:hypothetical protein